MYPGSLRFPVAFGEMNGDSETHHSGLKKYQRNSDREGNVFFSAEILGEIDFKKQGGIEEYLSEMYRR